MTPTHFYTGQEVMVFDSNAWREKGGDTRSDDFYRKATILKFYPDYTIGLEPHTLKDTIYLIDVRFEHDGRISKGHWANEAREIFKRETT